MRPPTGLLLAIVPTTLLILAGCSGSDSEDAAQQMVTAPAPSSDAGRGVPVLEGAAVLGVDAGSPVSRAGLREGDIITRSAEDEIHGVGDVAQALTRRGPGERVTVTYYRGREQQMADIIFAERAMAPARGGEAPDLVMSGGGP